MDIVFLCVHCRQRMIIDGHGCGLEIECPGCKRKTTVPKSYTNDTRDAPTVNLGLGIGPWHTATEAAQRWASLNGIVEGDRGRLYDGHGNLHARDIYELKNRLLNNGTIKRNDLGFYLQN